MKEMKTKNRNLIAEMNQMMRICSEALKKEGYDIDRYSETYHRFSIRTEFIYNILVEFGFDLDEYKMRMNE